MSLGRPCAKARGRLRGAGARSSFGVTISSYLGMGQNVFLTVPTSVLLWKYCLVKVYFFSLPGGVSDFFLPTLKYVTHVTNLSVTKKVFSLARGVVVFLLPAFKAAWTSGLLGPASA